ncbi:Bug family tripartite tricarboxylate transporter substrate binding protein [Polaromonas sp. UC242_47]|uniref:Bug family tripartite tricarboxylate transporter substrate binding protein n=1 Tax=Polaromonas sp. UC242_47 TaxID=3374626 RepID=UPI0037B5138F
MRRLFLNTVLGAAAAVGLFSPALAESWPAAGKTMQIIVPAPGGGGTGDTIARLLAEQLTTRLKMPVVIDNRGGANGNIGAVAAAGATPDGYRLLFSWAGTLAVNPSLYRHLPFDPRRDFEPIALVADVPNIIVVNNALPVKDVAALIAYAKTRPGQLNFGSTGNGSSMHLAGELFMRETGSRLVHVPYNAPGLATTNLIANDIQMMFQLVPGIVGQVKGGNVRALAVMSASRSPALPDVPTLAELGYPKLLSSTWFALLAPKNTPPAILDRLNTEVNAVLAMPEFKKRLADLGAVPMGGSRQLLADHLSAETTKWGRIVSEAKIQSD